LTPQISKRAYEIYEKRGRQSDHAAQDWEEAKREIRADETKTEPEQPEPVAKAEPERKAKISADITPQVVKRVHDLYEELGRKDLEAVQSLDNSKQQSPKQETGVQPKPEGKAEPQGSS